MGNSTDRKPWQSSFQNAFFSNIHQNNLIYNSCWEDPRIDRQLIQLDQQSKVVMITSAGCNALDYLLDSPAEIHAVDMNPRQNALLQLKRSLIERGNFEELFAMFGKGMYRACHDLYAGLRKNLPLYAREYWDKHIDYFEPHRFKKTFYYHGTSGYIAWLFVNWVRCLKKNIRNFFLDLLEAQSLHEQKTLYSAVEAELWNRFNCWFVKHPLVMTMFGVPKAQIRLIVEQYPGGIVAYIRDKVQHVFTEVSIEDNYFWRVYLTGSYTRDCCPNYLKEDNFDLLRGNVERLMTHTSTLTQFLRKHPGTYSHFVLLDHQDWLAEHNTLMLEEEWREIFRCGKAGAKILMRSAGQYLDFLPEWVSSSLRFFPELTSELHRSDRVGTYGSLHFAEIL